MLIPALVIGGLSLAGAGASLYSAYKNSQDEQDEIDAQAAATQTAFDARQLEETAALEREIAASKEKTERDITEAQAQFEIQRENAQEQASDWEADANAVNRQATKKETLLSAAYGSTMDQLSAQDERFALQEQRAKQSQLQDQSSLAAIMGASGVRSDTSQAQIIVQNEQAFNQNLDQARKENTLSKQSGLMSAYQGLSENMMNLGEGRRNAAEALSDADRLRNDYRAGGRASSLFDLQIGNARANAASSETLARANAAGKLNLDAIQHQLQQEAFDRASDRAKFDWLSGDPWVAAFSGGNTGLSFGNNAYDFYKKWGK